MTPWSILLSASDPGVVPHSGSQLLAAHRAGRDVRRRQVHPGAAQSIWGRGQSKTQAPWTLWGVGVGGCIGRDVTGGQWHGRIFRQCDELLEANVNVVCYHKQINLKLCVQKALIINNTVLNYGVYRCDNSLWACNLTFSLFHQSSLNCPSAEFFPVYLNLFLFLKEHLSISEETTFYLFQIAEEIISCLI